MHGPSQSAPGSRCGTVAIVGKPNAGKSTLLNALVDTPLSIVSDKPQATRAPVVGVWSDACTQILFVDQPGILEPRYLLHEAMRETHVESVKGSDAILYLTPQGERWVPLEQLEPAFASLGKPVANVISKADRPRPEVDVPDPVFVISAPQKQGLPAVLEWCRTHMPEGPFRYDPDDISTQPVRFFVAEYVREAAFNSLSDELPYSVATEVDEFREGSQPLYIRVTIFVERESQKGIVVGRGGSLIKEIGTIARPRIEELVGQRVFLDLWVKVLPKWRTKPSALARFGLPLTTGEKT